MRDSAVSELNTLPSTKEEIEIFAERVVTAVMDGDENPLEILAQCFKAKKALAMIEDKIVEIATNEARKYSENQAFSVYGVECKVKRVGMKYGYDVSSDWNECQMEINKIREKQKAIESALKNSDKHPYIEESTGEQVTSIPTQWEEKVCLTIK